jgi:hypothetical protein
MPHGDSHRLYTLVLPGGSRGDTTGIGGRNTAQITPLSAGTSTTESISVEPGQFELTGYFRGRGADRLTKQLEELFSASGYESVPFVSLGAKREDDGYYTLESIDAEPVEEAARGYLHRYTATLEEAGTRRSSFRSVEIAVDSAPNPLGTTEESVIGVPAAATDSLTRWYDYSANTLTPATPTTTVATEFSDVELFDVAAAPSPTAAALVYDLPYTNQGKTDVRVWDDRDRGLTAKTDADSVVQWARVFVASHEYQGRPVVSNGRFRVLLNEDPATRSGVQAERWDPGASRWTSVALGSNPEGWALIDADLTRIGAAAVRAQLLFRAEDGTQAPLNTRLSRGEDVLLFSTPPNAPAATPVSLRDLMEPIASDRLQTAGESLGLRAREEVRR